MNIVRKDMKLMFGIGASGCLTDLGGSDFDISVYEEEGKRILGHFMI